MTRIAISYRRGDSGVIAGRIFDRLVANYGRDAIFRDIDSIPAGVDFRVHINKVLSQADVILALVGPRWIGPRRGSRLDDEADPVRVEVETALQRGVPLIPVLVMGASMPRVAQLPDSLRDFAFRNAVQVDAGQDFDNHISRLIRAIDGLVTTSGDVPTGPPADTTPDLQPDRHKLRRGAAITIIAAALVAAAAIIGLRGFYDRQNPAPQGSVPENVTPPPHETAALPNASPASPMPGVDDQAAFWQRIATSDNPTDFQEYLSKYPPGSFAEIAHSRLASLKPSSSSAPAPEASMPATPPPQNLPAAASGQNAAARSSTEQLAAAQYPGFRSTNPPPSSPVEVKQEIARFTVEFKRLRQDQHNMAETGRLLKLFSDSVDRVRQSFVVEVSAKRLVDGAIKGMTEARTQRNASDEELIGAAINGMLGAVDPHSNYLDEKTYSDMKIQTRGEFGGLGIEVALADGLVKVVSPIDDTPAARAGVRPGDLITHIDGVSVQGLTLPEAVAKMRGPIGSNVVLTVKRAANEPFPLMLTRAKILINPVRSHLEGGDIGYIRIATFNERTDGNLVAAVRNLKEQAGGKLAGIILDLRNDPGGLLDQAVAVADEFLEAGKILAVEGRRSEDTQRYTARPGDIAGGLPLVVMINYGTAAGAEIAAAALQDNHRAVVLGTRSFGKGSLQTIFPIPGHGALRVTTALDVTPSGRLLQGLGITPDKIVEVSEGSDHTATPTTFGGPEDRQYLAAVDLMRTLAHHN
jgi:C-terminal peptidase prc